MIIIPHLTWAEAVHTDRAEFAESNAAAAEEFREAIIDTARSLFTPIRDHVGGPITITSFFRCGPLNRRVGGSEGSQHLVGRAIDLKPVAGDLRRLWRWIAFTSGIEFGQCLLEGYGLGGGPRWIHISSRVGRDPGKCDQVGFGPSGHIYLIPSAEVVMRRKKDLKT